MTKVVEEIVENYLLTIQIFNQLKRNYMFYHNGKLQFDAKVNKPDPQAAKILQQIMGGIKGEMKANPSIAEKTIDKLK